MKQTFFNTEFLVKIEVIDKQIVNSFEWRPFKKTKWYEPNQKEGFYWSDGIFGSKSFLTNIESELFSKKMINQNYFIEDKVVYLKCHIVLHFLNDHGYTKYFNTYESAKDYANGFLNNKNFVELKIIK